MTNLPYLLPWFVPIAMLGGFLQGQTWSFRIVLVTFALVTVLDLVLGSRTQSNGVERAHASRRGSCAALAPWIWLPAQAAILICGMVAISGKPVLGFEWITTAVCVGLTGGMLGMPAAHELMHRRARLARLQAAAQMALLSYAHFCVEHVHGHHARVATPPDPATARLGESIYAFYPRAVLGGFAGAWRAEAYRLRRRNLPVLSLRNEVLRGLILVGALYAVVTFAFGWPGAAFFAVQSLVGLSIVETVNYVQHYGLVRRQRADGSYERVSPAHAWNSDHAVSNWFLLNLGRHSDHHCHADRHFDAVRDLVAAPRLPTGLYGMWLLALFPPLWFGVMDPLAAAHCGGQSGVDEAAADQGPSSQRTSP